MIFGFGMCVMTALPLNNTGMPALEIAYLIPGTIAFMAGLGLVRLAAAPPNASLLAARLTALRPTLPEPIARRLEEVGRPIILATVASIIGGPIFAVVTVRAGSAIITRIFDAGLYGDAGLVSALWELLGGGLIVVWLAAARHSYGPRSVRMTEVAALAVVMSAGALLVLYK